jgi:hypothetical protein
MRPTLRLALLLMAMALPAPPVVHAAEPSLEGLYGAEGVNPDRSKYRAVVRVVRHGESYVVAWIFADEVDGAVVLVPRSGGVGVTSGGTFAVSYYAQDGTGVILYQIEGGGERLVGRWVSANGDGAVQSETLTRLAIPRAVPDTGTSGVPPKRPVRRAPGTIVARH